MWAHKQRKMLLSGLWIWSWAFTEIIDVSVAFFTQKTFIYQIWSTVKRDFNAFSVSLPWLHIFPYNSDPVEKVSLSHCSTHTSFLPVITIYVSSTMCCKNFHTSSPPQSALSQNLPLPCHLGTRGKDISFCFCASHQAHDSPQNADDFSQDNSQTRTAKKMLLLCSSQPWNTFLCSYRECNSLKFVFWIF